MKSTPFLMAGLSVAMAFRCGIWNIGAEGQFLIGALTATWFGTKLAPIFSRKALGLRCRCVLDLRHSSRGRMGTHSSGSQGGARGQRSYQHDYVELRRAPSGEYDDRWRSLAGGKHNAVRRAIGSPNGCSCLGLSHRIESISALLSRVILAIILTFVLFRTAFGYQLRAVGEGAAAAEAAGISIVQNTLRVLFHQRCARRTRRCN